MVSALALIMGACSSQSELASDTAATKTMMLSGTGSDDAVEWDFYCDKGRNCGEWSKIAVPSNWELEGFGGYDYGHIREKHDEQGTFATHARPTNTMIRSTLQPRHMPGRAMYILKQYSQ